MKNKTGFIKLLLIAVLCDFLIVVGYLMIAMNIDYKDYNSAMDGIGFVILWNTLLQKALIYYFIWLLIVLFIGIRFIC